MSVSPARSPAWVRRARTSTSTARAASPGCFFFGPRVDVLRRAGAFLAGGRRLAAVRVRVATVATTVTAATAAPHHPVLGTKIRVLLGYLSPERSLGGLSDLHDDGDDHRAALGALADEAADGLAAVAAEGLEVGGARGGRLLQRVADGLAGFLEEVLGFGRVDPAPGQDLGAADDLAGADVDGDDDHHHALFAEHTPVAQDAVADVTHDAVDVEEAGRHLVDELGTVVGQLDDVAVLGQQHVRLGDAHLHRQPRVVDEMTELAVHRDEELGLGDRQERLQFLLLGVAADVHVGNARVHDLGTEPVEPVDDLVDVVLVT